jgi:outer membrane protein OmpA-like peptidoglycan-associated protein
VGALPGEIYFPVSSSRLGTQATTTLDKAVRWLNANSDAQLIIEGHADPTGNPDSNMTLSQKRAELVRDHLVSAGIDASRIEVVPLGDTRLKYGRTDARNRRAALVKK